MNYLDYWKLKDKPFEGTRNTKFFFASESHAEALERLLYIIRDRNMNFGLLTGDIGSGKTITKTILEHQLLKENFEVVSIENACFPFHPTLIEIVSQLKNRKIDIKENDEYAAMNILKDLLVKIVIENDRHLVILLDEAHQLEKACLDKIKNLTNICSEDENYLTIILIGQPELKALIRSLPQLDQRVSLRYHLKYLPLKEVKDYINHRLRVAGCDNYAIFSNETIDLIYNATSGIPREINRVCRLALDSAFSDKKTQVSESIVISIIKDINIQSSTSNDLGKTDPLYNKSSESDNIVIPENHEDSQIPPSPFTKGETIPPILPLQKAPPPYPPFANGESTLTSFKKGDRGALKSASERILMLDDSLPDNNPVFNMLIDQGYSVILSKKVKGCLTKIPEHVDLVIIRIDLKKGSDRTLFKHITTLKDVDGVPLLILTDPPSSLKANKEKEKKLKKLSGERLLFSPFKIEQLDHKIETLLIETLLKRD